MSARHPTVANAIDTFVGHHDDDDAAAWALAIRSLDSYCSYERTAMRGLALALLTGDAPRALRAARWLTDPADAMAAALAEVSP